MKSAFCFIYALVFSFPHFFTTTSQKVTGHYFFNKQEIKGARAYHTIHIHIKKNSTYLYEDDSHIFGSLKENGTWTVSFDTLILYAKKNNISKYLISKNKLCWVDPETKEADFCLYKKQGN